MRNSGNANPIAILLILGLITGIYLAVLGSSAWTDNFDVQNAVNSAVNQSNRDDDTLRELIKGKLRYVGTHKEDDGYGNLVEKQGLGLTDDQIDIERDDVNNTITISVDYTREVQLKPTQKIWTIHFHPSKTGPIKQ